jgi:tRNA G46 methylase TrmB
MMVDVKKKIMLDYFEKNCKKEFNENFYLDYGSIFDKLKIICGDIRYFFSSNILIRDFSVSFIFINYPQPPTSLTSPPSSYYINSSFLNNCERILKREGEIILITVYFYF